MEWISIKDQIPPNGPFVWKDDVSGQTGIASHFRNIWGNSISSGGKKIWFCTGNWDCITHWMPLPKATKELSDVIQRNETKH